MTVAAKPRSIDYAEDGVTLVFAVPWRFTAPADVKAQRTTLDGTRIDLTHGADFSVTGGTTDEGGELTLTAAGAAGAALSIWTETPRSQTAEYETNGTFPAETHEARLDQLAMVDQEQDVEIGRALRVGRGKVPLPVNDIAEGQVLGRVGDELVGIDNDVTGAAVYAAASALSAAQSADERAAAEDAKEASEGARDQALEVAADIAAANIYRTGIATATKAALTALAGPFSEGDSAAVYADGTTANNGIYSYTSGAWVKVADLPDVAAAASAADAASARDVALAAVYKSRAGSVRFPYDNGYDNLAEAGSKYGSAFVIATPNDLLKNPDNSNKGIFGSGVQGAIAWRGEVNLEEFAALRSIPSYLTNDRPGQAGNFRIDLWHEPKSDIVLTDDDVDRDWFRLRDTSLALEFKVKSAAFSDGFTGDGVRVARKSLTGVTLDLFAAIDGTKYAGVEQANPAGWTATGPLTLSNVLAVGVSRPAAYPFDPTEGTIGSKNAFGAFRGSYAGWLIVDGPTTDAQWQAFAKGGDPYAIFTDVGQTIRFWHAGAANGAVTRAFTTSGVKLASGNMGVYAAGSTAPTDAQIAAAFLPGRDFCGKIYARRYRGPAIVPMIWPDLKQGFLPLEGRSDYAANTPMETRLVNVAGTRIVRDWIDEGQVLGPTWSATFRIPADPDRLVLQARAKGSAEFFVLHDEIVPDITIEIDGQSQVAVGLSQAVCFDYLSDRTKGGYGANWTGSRFKGSKQFLILKGREGPRERYGILRGYTPHLLGGGVCEFFKRLELGTDMHTTLVISAISGTALRDKLSSEDGGAGFDARDMEDNYKKMRVIAGRDAAGKIGRTMFIQHMHSADDAGADSGNLLYSADFTGAPTSYVPDVDDWPFSGKEVTTTSLPAIFPLSRYGTTGAPVTPLYTDTRTEHLQRKSVEDQMAAYGVAIGPRTDFVHVDFYVAGDPTQPGYGPHPEDTVANGSDLWGRIHGEGARGLLGFGPYRYSAKPVKLQFIDADHALMLFDMQTGGKLERFKEAELLAANPADFGVSGVEVNGDRRNFTAELYRPTGGATHPRAILLTRTGGAAWAIGVTTASYNQGGPGAYGQFDVDDWQARQLTFLNKLGVSSTGFEPLVMAA